MIRDLTAPIVIAGGGIGGLSAALALAKRGYPSIVLEQAPEFKEVGAGIQLGPNSWRCLRELGLEAAVKKVAVFPEALVMMDSVSAEQVVSIPLGGFESRFGAPYALAHRADLLNVLLAACSAEPLITLETSRHVKSFADDGKSVRLTTTEGHVYDTPAFIGADGCGRRCAASSSATAPAHIGTCELSLGAARRGRAGISPPLRWFLGRAECHMVHYPVRGGELFNLVARSTATATGKAGTRSAIPRAARAQSTLRRCAADAVEDRGVAYVGAVRPRADQDVVKGRVTLTGDAAHPMLQHSRRAGGGARDALCLAACLDEADSVEAAFTAFPLKRSCARTRAVGSALQGEFYHAEGVRRVRNEYVERVKASRGSR
jgi:salicylate hydroxylase